MFSGTWQLKPESDGSYFIKRDGTNFRYILNYIQNGKLSIPENDTFLVKELLEEAEFYQIQPLIEYLKKFVPISNSSSIDSVLLIPEYLEIFETWLSGQFTWKLLYRVSTHRLHKANEYRHLETALLPKHFTWNVTTKEKLLLLLKTLMEIYLEALPLQIGMLMATFKKILQQFYLHWRTPTTFPQQNSFVLLRIAVFFVLKYMDLHLEIMIFIFLIKAIQITARNPIFLIVMWILLKRDRNYLLGKEILRL